MTEQINETKIKKVLFNEISLFIATVGIISSGIFWVTNPQQDLEIKMIRLESQIENYEKVSSILQGFKDNDLHEIALSINRLEANQLDTIKAIARIEALLE